MPSDDVAVILVLALAFRYFSQVSRPVSLMRCRNSTGRVARTPDFSIIPVSPLGSSLKSSRVTSARAMCDRTGTPSSSLTYFPSMSRSRQLFVSSAMTTSCARRVAVGFAHFVSNATINAAHVSFSAAVNLLHRPSKECSFGWKVLVFTLSSWALIACNTLLTITLHLLHNPAFIIFFSILGRHYSTLPMPVIRQI
ncbi:hypothetical protein B0H11DRAFT_1989991 [Mycena galericulata]|nr:hypothetical protein B0H11DRAFT_2045138 [Mycena galericulata]KAJ7502274.1 hypothetical protein B0H11DRAFT_1989991 [Mycena galericulata]